MARIARVVVPHVAHHLTQRGVRRINIFDDAKDKKSYIKILSELSLEENLGTVYQLNTNLRIN